jgi:hypothetical protein
MKGWVDSIETIIVIYISRRDIQIGKVDIFDKSLKTMLKIIYFTAVNKRRINKFFDNHE